MDGLCVKSIQISPPSYSLSELSELDQGKEKLSVAKSLLAHFCCVMCHCQSCCWCSFCFFFVGEQKQEGDECQLRLDNIFVQV